MLAPFRGVRYAPGRVTGLAEVTSPPYDVVGAAVARQLRDSDPHNVIRLTLPAGDGGTGARQNGRYRAAGRTMRQWIAEGVLAPDNQAALYVYEECAGAAGTYPAGAAVPQVQRGLIGAVELAPHEAGIVLPHEEVTAAVVADRRQLMEATEANLEPIFLVYEGGGTASQLVEEVARRRKPLIEGVAGGVTHRLWAVTDPSGVAAVAEDLAGRHAMIADGHHRYAAYLDLQARRHASGLGSGPWDYGLALLVDSLAYPPRIHPIHRVVPGLAPETAVRLARSAFTVRSLPRGIDLGGALRQLCAASHADAAAGTGRDFADNGRGCGGNTGTGIAGGPGRGSGAAVAFLVAGKGAFHLLTQPDPAQVSAAAPAGQSERRKWLAASVLHELLIKRVWGIPDDQARVRMVHEDAPAAIQAAEPAGTAVICNPPDISDVLAIAAAGEKMPRKSTSFGPKPRTGLVMRSFAYG